MDEKFLYYKRKEDTLRFHNKKDTRILFFLIVSFVLLLIFVSLSLNDDGETKEENFDTMETLSFETKECLNRTPVEMLFSTSEKTYMDYRAITDETSNQHKLIHSDEIDIYDDSFLRDGDGYIGVAMGSYFGPIGTRYICHLDTDKEIRVIKVEAKDDRHAIDGFCGSIANDIIEFVIDTEAEWMQSNVWANGYIFNGNFNNYEEFNGKIIAIEKIEILENNC